MPAPLIRANYDSLKQISKEFRRQASDLQRTLKIIERQKQELQSGGWVGQGANTFYREMDDDVMPSLKRLTTSLASADRVTRQIYKLMSGVEEDWKVIFQSEGEGGTSSTQPGADGRGPSGSAPESGDRGIFDRALDAVDKIREALNESTTFQSIVKFFSNMDSIKELSEMLDVELPDSWKKVIDTFYKNRALRKAIKPIPYLGTGLDVVNFLADPSFQTTVDLGVGLIGSIPNPYTIGAGVAYDLGSIIFPDAYQSFYDFGSEYIEAPLTEAASEALDEWSWQDLGFEMSF